MAIVRVLDLLQKFKWKVVTGDNQSFQRQVYLPDTNRPGLELVGYFQDTQAQRLIVLGDKEIGYIEEKMDEISQRRIFEFLTSEDTPAILVAHGHTCPEILKEIAQRKNFPIFETDHKTSTAIVNITNFLDERLARSIILHGELMRIHGVGVMITGNSGMGKSEVALELIKRGHQLVADDRIDCYRIHNSLIGRTPKMLEGFMELRGVGIINVGRMFGIGAFTHEDDRIDCYRIHNSLIGRTPKMLEGFMELRGVGIINVGRMFGIGAFTHETEIQFQIQLEPFDDSVEYDRVGIEEKEYSEILGIKILKLRIPVSMGRPMSTIIETAVTNFLLLKEGFDSAKDFEERVIAQIKKNQEEDDATIS